MQSSYSCKWDLNSILLSLFVSPVSSAMKDSTPPEGSVFENKDLTLSGVSCVHQAHQVKANCEFLWWNQCQSWIKSESGPHFSGKSGYTFQNLCPSPLPSHLIRFCDTLRTVLTFKAIFCWENPSFYPSRPNEDPPSRLKFHLKAMELPIIRTLCKQVFHNHAGRQNFALGLLL